MEYKVIYIGLKDDPQEMEKEINHYAAQGWEVISVAPVSKAGWMQMFFEAGITSGFTVVFKKVN